MNLPKENLSISDVASLLEDESKGHLEKLAQAAHELTVRIFGRTIKLYAPIYISNTCVNGCAYCGFANKNSIERRTLTPEEVLAEAEAITRTGHRQILIVAGEDPKNLPLEAIEKIARAIRPRVAQLSVEVQPFDEDGYKKLAAAGVDGVTLYQETYDRKVYEQMHPHGPKRIFGSRTNAIDAAGRAGMRFLGIGALLGLSNWREETLAIVAHARGLMKKYWKSAITISVPRIRSSESEFKMPSPVSDRELAHMISVLRLALPECGITLSTREPAELRDRLLPLGITQMSAGSVTKPGGYTERSRAGEQFHLEDNRPPAKVAAMLKNAGYDPVWKDWE